MRQQSEYAAILWTSRSHLIMPRYTNALRNSGADGLLQPYRTHRAGLVGNGASMIVDDDVQYVIEWF